ncbi:MAG: hypothetical protein ACFB9M_21185 [Myxococcota bacterium]
MRDEETGSHYVTASNVLLSVGAVGLLLGGAAWLTGADWPFAETRGFVGTGAVVAAVGVVLRLIKPRGEP